MLFKYDRLKTDGSFNTSASPFFVSEATSPVLDSGETIIEGPFGIVCDSPGGVGEVLVT